MIFACSDDLFAPRVAAFEAVKPWKPEALDHTQWPPDYRGVYAWRIETLAALRADDDLLAAAHAYYADRPGEFIMHWMDTYNPRKADNKWMPFVFFRRQTEFITFLHQLRHDGENGLVEKCRDAGATWLACAYSVWSWLFIPNDAIGWGSRKQDLVDKLGDADSIFEKMRLIVRRLPDVWQPLGLKPRDHMTYLKMVNPANGATITGEAGDNIGRGGRKSLYFKDESAHYERPEKIEAALGDNTNCQIDISSVNGLGNVFHRRREAGVDWSVGVDIEPGFTRVFVIDWRDHPEKTQEWYDLRKAKAEREGMQHVFAQEVERNYSAAVSNTIIAYEWIDACVDAHLHIPYLRIPPPNIWSAGLDVADEGQDRNALALRQWIIVRSVEEWGARDPGVTMRQTVKAVRDRRLRGVRVQADLIGVGAGVKTEYNRLVQDGLVAPDELQLVFWNAGGGVVDPLYHVIPDDDNSPRNRDFFGNFKAQAWWSLRTRCYKTFKARTEGVVYPPDELISFDGTMPLINQLKKELAQPTQATSSGLRMIVDKKPAGTRSPNLADSVVQVMFPVPDRQSVVVGSYSG